MSELIEQLITPTNRQVKRAMLNERDRINRSVGTLLQVEEDFIGNLFNNKCNSYEEIYKFYLAEFIEHANFHASRLKLKFYKINPYYFRDTYKPLEQCKA